MTDDGQFAWSTQLGAGIVRTPALGRDGSIYVSYMEDTSESLPPFTVRPHTGTPTGQTASAAPKLKAGALICLDSTGSERWRFPLNANRAEAPIVDSNGTVYFVSDNQIYCVSSGGQERWRLDTPPAQWVQMILAEPGVLLAFDPLNVYEYRD